MKYVCQECGSDQIQTLEWVDVNTNKPLGGRVGELIDNWCNQCEDHTYFITEKEFIEKKEE